VYGYYAATPYEQSARPWGRRALTHWNVVDTVKIPERLGDGCPAWGCDYILSFRMDSEQTPEVWTNCAGNAALSLPHRPTDSSDTSPTAPHRRACADVKIIA
jgi:hypothetical protein